MICLFGAQRKLDIHLNGERNCLSISVDIIFELAMSVLVISGLFRWAAAIALAVFTPLATFIAFRFWTMPAGMDRTMR